MPEKKVPRVTVSVDEGKLVIYFPLGEGKTAEERIKASGVQGLLNNPWETGQLGFVMDASFVDFSKEAVEAIRNIPKSDDDIGDVMVYTTAKGKNVFGWLGGPSTVNALADITLSNSCTPEILEPAGYEVALPESYVEYKVSLK